MLAVRCVLSLGRCLLVSFGVRCLVCCSMLLMPMLIACLLFAVCCLLCAGLVGCLLAVCRVHVFVV